MIWGVLLICLLFGVAQAQKLESQDSPRLWQAAQVVMLEVAGQKIPENPEPDGLRGIVAWLLERAARPPPAWFLTGIVQRQAGLSSPDTRALARRMAWLQAGQFPSLADLNLSVIATAFEARAEFGAAFAVYLIERFGLGKLKTVLKFFYANWSLSDAFLEVLGIRLESLFEDWQVLEATHAVRQTAQLRATGLPTGLAIGNELGIATWLSETEFIAIQSAGLYRGQLGNSKLELLLGLPFVPSRLSLATDGALIYSRPRAYGAISGEVFRFFQGQEVQLTVGANATEAVADGLCVIFAKAASSLWRWCDGKANLLWTAPKGWRVGHLASRENKIAMTVVRGTFWDIAVLTNNLLELQTSDLAHDQTPIWLDSKTLLYSSDRLGTPQLWTIRLGEKTSEQVSAMDGGAFEPQLLPNGMVSCSSFLGTDTETRLVSFENSIAVPLEFSQTQIPNSPVPNPPSLLPDVGIAFSSGIGAEAKGNNGVLAFRLAGGYDLFGVAGFGADFSMRFAPTQGWFFNANGSINQARGYGILARATWFGTGEIFAEPVGVVFSPFITLDNGVATAWFDFGLGAGLSDAWGYTTQNWQLFARINSQAQYSLGLALADTVAGATLETSFGSSGRLGAAPALSARLAARASLPIYWRFGDGVLSFERLTLYTFGVLSAREVAWGLQVLLDGVLNYNTIFTLGLELGYSSRGAWVFGIVWR